MNRLLRIARGVEVTFGILMLVAGVAKSVEPQLLVELLQQSLSGDEAVLFAVAAIVVFEVVVGWMLILPKRGVVGRRLASATGFGSALLLTCVNRYITSTGSTCPCLGRVELPASLMFTATVCGGVGSLVMLLWANRSASGMSQPTRRFCTWRRWLAACVLVCTAGLAVARTLDTLGPGLSAAQIQELRQHLEVRSGERVLLVAGRPGCSACTSMLEHYMTRAPEREQPTRGLMLYSEEYVAAVREMKPDSTHEFAIIPAALWGDMILDFAYRGFVLTTEDTWLPKY